MEKRLNTIETILTSLLVFLIPVTILPLFANIFITPKLIILTWGVSMLLVIKALKNFFRDSLNISTGTFDLPVIFLAAAYLASSIIQTPNKQEAFFLPGTGTIIAASSILYFIISGQKARQKQIITLSMISAAAITSIVSLIAATGILKSFTSLPAIMKDPAFSLQEGSPSSLIYLICALPLCVAELFTVKNKAKKVILGTSSVIITLGIGINLLNTLPGRPSSPKLPPFQTSWVVAVDSIRESPLIGIGPGNYLSAFNLYKPISFNSTNNWSLSFASGRNFYLTLAAETGIIGLIGIALLTAKLFELAKNYTSKKQNNQAYHIPPAMISILFLLSLFLIFPATMTTLVILFVLLALLASTQKTELKIIPSRQTKPPRLPLYLSSIVLFILIAPFLFFSGKAFLAENKYYSGLLAASRGDGKASYDLIRESIELNPSVDRYHITYSQLNLNLANSMAIKNNLTDEDKNTVSKLIEQSIREAKIAISLNPSRSGNWENLGNLYKAILPLAKGSDQFGVQSLKQAIALDPLNPNLRVALGGLFYQIKDFQSAIDTLKLAVAAKPDYANSHYNLALAYREIGDYENASAELNKVLDLVDKSSKDYELAKSALENLKSQTPPSPAVPEEPIDKQPNTSKNE